MKILKEKTFTLIELQKDVTNFIHDNIKSLKGKTQSEVKSAYIKDRGKSYKQLEQAIQLASINFSWLKECKNQSNSKIILENSRPLTEKEEKAFLLKQSQEQDGDKIKAVGNQPFTKAMKDLAETDKQKEEHLKVKTAGDEGMGNKKVTIPKSKNLKESKKPKYWDTTFSDKVIKAYKAGKLNNKIDIEKWEKEYNGGTKPNPAFNTTHIIDYYLSTEKNLKESFDDEDYKWECEKCGAEFEPNDSGCPKCGNKGWDDEDEWEDIDEDLNFDDVECSNCGAIGDFDNNGHCRSCEWDDGYDERYDHGYDPQFDEDGLCIDCDEDEELDEDWMMEKKNNLKDKVNLYINKKMKLARKFGIDLTLEGDVEGTMSECGGLEDEDDTSYWIADEELDEKFGFWLEPSTQNGEGSYKLFYLENDKPVIL